MILNYLKLTIRTFNKQKLFGAINLFGLSIGIAVSFLLLLFVQNELTFDTIHSKADRIYRAWVLEDYGPDQIHFNTVTPVPLGPKLKETLPEIEAVTRFDQKLVSVRRGERSFNETAYLVDDTFLDVFDFPLIEGRKEDAYSAQNNVVLTRSSANRYFGTENPMGQTILIKFNDEPRPFVVSGVLENTPVNSSLQFEFLVPYSITEWLYPPRLMTAWFNIVPETYVLFREGADVAAAEAKMKPLFNRLLADRIEKDQYTVGFQPLLDIRLNPDFPQGYSTVINPIYVEILLGIALLVLAIACINFLTLSVGRSYGRSREIGVRKVMGAHRSLSIVFSTSTVALLGGLFVIVSVLAGLYPAIVMSGFRPVHALQGNVGGRGDHSYRRSTGRVVSSGGSTALGPYSSGRNSIRFIGNGPL